MPKPSAGGMEPGNVGKLVFAVVALIAAAGFLFWYIRSNQEHEVGHAEQPPGTNIKLQEMKAMKEGKSPDGSAAPATSSDSGSAPDAKAPGGAKDPMSLGDK
ncbi:MAG TPA: hypothetical protein VKU00_12870 [Chthonomonadaceae bacterium]|nr:hypothetical protein [Chthonomonadaceae bacterium]